MEDDVHDVKGILCAYSDYSQTNDYYKNNNSQTHKRYKANELITINSDDARL